MRAESQGFPYDRQMPGLALATDPVAMRGLLGRHLALDEEPGWETEACSITRIRYRPHERCILQYTLTLHDMETCAKRDLWITGVVYAEPARRARHARRTPRARLIDALGMLVSRFPDDHRLPHAGTLMAGEDVELRAAALEVFGPGTWRMEELTVEPVRYREHLSLVVRCHVRAREIRSGVTAERVVYVKTYPSEAAARQAFEQHRQLAVHAVSTQPGYSVETPLAFLEHLQAVMVPASEGRPLAEVLRDEADVAKIFPAVREAARGLASFHLSAAPTTRHYRVSEYLESLDRCATTLQWACPDRAVDVRWLVDVVAREARDVTPRPTHRDMKPEHVLVGGEAPAFIDLDSCAAADAVLDVGLMLARFAGLSLEGSERLSEVATVFSEEYFDLVPAHWRTRLRLYYASSVLEVAGSLFHRQRPNWPSHVPRLIDAAREAMGEG